ncbi:MAG TPA: four helix bundle protein [Acidobacteriaceae bacterium]|nr:four helix bundle protein [Acidobacteriaceae bacterium]
MAKSFRDLEVWNLSMDLTMLIYAITSDFPKHEIYGLSSQMRRAAVSISSNLAEGSARGSKRDFRQFVLIARGSNCELQTQLMIAARLNYSPGGKITEAEELCQRISRMSSGLSNFLKINPAT